jgi:hypothetical protein
MFYGFREVACLRASGQLQAFGKALETDFRNGTATRQTMPCSESIPLADRDEFPRKNVIFCQPKEGSYSYAQVGV